MKHIFITIVLFVFFITITISLFANGEKEREKKYTEDTDLEIQGTTIIETTDNIRPVDEHTPRVESIIHRLEQNQVFEGLESSGKIAIKDQYGTRTISYHIHAKDSELSLLEFTSSAEKGQKILRVENKIYLYYPDAEQIITLNQSMFQQSILDSDISYEDMAGDKSIQENYYATLEGLEEKNGYDSYRIYLSAIDEQSVTYPYQRIWVRRDTFTLHASALYTRKKVLRKILEAHNLEQVSEGRFIISEYTFKDVLKHNTSTTIYLEDIIIDQVDDNIFSIENLKF